MSAVVNLEVLGPRGFSLDGHNRYDGAGLRVSGAGDVNGDGFDDIIVGANYASSAYVIYGHPGGFGPIDLGNIPASAGFLIQGASAFDETGIRVSRAGDVNGDGFDDLIVSSAPGGFYYSGVSKAYVIFGHPGGFNTVNLATLAPSDGFEISAQISLNYNVLDVANAGDINGDGFDDLIIGSRSTRTAYVIFGHSGTFGSVQLPSLGTAGFQITGAPAAVTVSGVGDVNGDGFADFLVSAGGRTTVLFGHGGTFANVDLSNLPPSAGFVIQGGVTAAAAGDFNGDGFADIIVGAPNDNRGGVGAGAAYVIFGHAGPFGAIDLANLSPFAGFAVVGASPGDLAGTSVAAAGDVNGDGLSDIIIGAPNAGNGGVLGGQAYVIFGHAGPFPTVNLTNLSPSLGLVMTTGTAGQGVGSSVAGAGDVNADGLADVIVGAPNASRAAPHAGAAFVVFGNGIFNAALGRAGDFNGDGRDDLLLRSKTGSVTDWLAISNDGFRDNSANFVAQLDSAWKIVGIGDFNGDGRSDILWRSKSGLVTDWLAKPDGGFYGNSANFLTQIDSGWQIVGTGDFNGDGRSDILWRSESGFVTDWLATPDGRFYGNSANFLAQIDSGWQIVGTGDFNGDGLTDILWRSGSGLITDWLSRPDGSFYGNSANFLTQLNSSWHIIGIGDFNGDRSDDLLWQSDSGLVTDWIAQRNGSFYGNSPNLLTQGSSTSHLIQTGDFNGDGFTDLLWRDAVGNLTEWLGTANGAFTINPNLHAQIEHGWQTQLPDLFM